MPLHIFNPRLCCHTFSFIFSSTIFSHIMMKSNMKDITQIEKDSFCIPHLFSHSLSSDRFLRKMKTQQHELSPWVVVFPHGNFPLIFLGLLYFSNIIFYFHHGRIFLSIFFGIHIIATKLLFL